MAQYTYDFKKHTITYGIIIIEDLLSEATFESGADLWLETKNIGGGGTRSKSNDKSGTFKFSINSSSPINAQLNAMIKADDLTGAGTAPFMVKNLLNNEEVLFADQAWIKKLPSRTFGQEETGVEYEISSFNWLYTTT